MPKHEAEKTAFCRNEAARRQGRPYRYAAIALGDMWKVVRVGSPEWAKR